MQPEMTWIVLDFPCLPTEATKAVDGNDATKSEVSDL